MQSVETIYQQTIRPLPVDEQRRLAEMILERAEEPEPKSRRSILEMLESIHAKTPRRSAAEIDEYIKTERDSWDD